MIGNSQAKGVMVKMDCGIAGLAVIGLGALVVIVGLILLVYAIYRIDKQSLTQARDRAKTSKSPISDLAKIIEALNETIRLIGVAQGVSVMIIVLGILLVIVGASIAGVTDLIG